MKSRKMEILKSIKTIPPLWIIDRETILHAIAHPRRYGNRVIELIICSAVCCIIPITHWHLMINSKWNVIYNFTSQAMRCVSQCQHTCLWPSAEVRFQKMFHVSKYKNYQEFYRYIMSIISYRPYKEHLESRQFNEISSRLTSLSPKRAQAYGHGFLMSIYKGLYA